MAVKLGDHLTGGCVQVAGTAIVAKPLPEFQHLVFGGLGQSVNRGEVLREAEVVAEPLLDARLLENHLREPDAVGIARLTPRQVAPMLLVPRYEGGSNRVAHRALV